ncbi:zinc ribbon domain-containing protein [Pseudobutyrivibrio sp. MD2005]|uniref:zinc ribbon domain-containing protein n=1 Tax=Pseudobutyrivibrio sp. MD2005 TaxID=1410616 RepID=UPI00047FB2E9|nr:zinc ribbon domain-containing protein [Pseudobutyrivibrio sp. MD2005]
MFCKFCGKNLPDDANFCNYCGGDLRENSQTIHKPVQEVRPSRAAEPQPVYNYNPGANKPKKGKGILIVIIALILVLLAGIGGFYAYENYMDSKEDSDSRIESTKNDDSKKDKKDKKSDSKSEKKSSKKNKEKPEVKKEAKLDKGFQDMSGKTLYFSHDAETIADSYWEFITDKECRLYNSDGSYLEGEYAVVTGDAGMRYTEKEFPEYSLTYDELESAVEANKETYTNSMDYVVVSFIGLVEYSAEGDVISDEPYPTTFYYGMTYDMDSYYVYELTGSNTAETYYFIDYDYTF